MPLDPLGILTDDEKGVILQKVDPLGVLTEEERSKLWTGPLAGQETLVVEDPQRLEKLRAYGLLDAWKDVGKDIGKGVVEAVTRPLPPLGPPKPVTPQQMEILKHGGLALIGGGLATKGVPAIAKVAPPVSAAPIKYLEPIKNVVEYMRSGPPTKGAKDLIRLVKTEMLSPESVYNMDTLKPNMKVPAGQLIYKWVDRADQAENRFLVTQVAEFQKALGGIKSGSDSALRVGRALDAKLAPEMLSGQEHDLYIFLKDKFDFLINQYVKNLIGDTAEYRRIAHAASRAYPPTSSLAELTQTRKSHYIDIAADLFKLRAGRKASQLTGTEADRYTRLKAEQLKLRQDQWIDNLTPEGRQGYSLLKRKIKNYLPHMFDRDELLTDFKAEIVSLENELRLVTDQSRRTQIADRLRTLYSASNKLEGGELVTYEDLPRNVIFKFFEPRKTDKPGYSFDAVKAYEAYLRGVARKMYKEPALRVVKQLHDYLDPELKDYNKWFMRNWLGMDQSVAQQIAGTIAAGQWMLKLGLNPSSAIVNWTQKLNTIVEAGELWSARGWRFGFSDEGKKLFIASGLREEVPSVLMEGVVPASVDRVRQIVGFMFTRVELGNRKHAFLTGYLKAKAQGQIEEKALQAGIDLAHKTQFRYGRVGMPKALASPVGRLAFQFWSFPIKQMEFLGRMARTNPLKFVKLLAYAEGGSWALGEFLGIDLSNALGVGMNYGEAIKAIKDIPRGDWEAFTRHVRLTVGKGGLLPTGFGPTVSSAYDVVRGVGEGRGLATVVQELTPVVGNKIWQTYQAVKNKVGSKYPVYSPATGEYMYDLTGQEMFLQAVGLRAKKGTEQYETRRSDIEIEKERLRLQEEVTKLIVDGKSDKAGKLISKYGPAIMPSDEAIVNEIERRRMSREQREALEGFGKKRVYRYQREGR
uniref:Uncharacterized protein n=1 Tax=viral metagenome TaxID=1070528 RepID=A0A6M3II59_9ZZZZ